MTSSSSSALFSCDPFSVVMLLLLILLRVVQVTSLSVSSGGRRSQDAQQRQRRADISQDLLANLTLYAQYTAAAYCAGNNNSTGGRITCSAGNCPLVQSSDVTSVDEFAEYVVLPTGGTMTDRTASARRRPMASSRWTGRADSSS